MRLFAISILRSLVNTSLKSQYLSPIALEEAEIKAFLC
jgi:hypothetical protein